VALLLLLLLLLLDLQELLLELMWKL